MASTSDMTRRSFIKTAGAAAAVAGAGTMAHGQEKKLGVGFIGVGSRMGAHIGAVDALIKEGHPPSDRKFDVKVPEGRLWVMGDNRSNSEDSRFHQDLAGGGTVPESAVVGKEWAVVWPLDRLDLLGTPPTFENPGLLVTGD